MKRPGEQRCAWHSYLAGVNSLITRRRNPQSSLECHGFVLKKYLGSEPPPESEDEVKLWSSQQGGALGGFGLVSDLVELADWGSPGPALPHGLEIRGCAGPLMGLIDSLERRFVFLGGMDDFTLVDEVTRVEAIKRLIFTRKPVFKAASEGKPRCAPRLPTLHQQAAPASRPFSPRSDLFQNANATPTRKRTLKPHRMVLIYKNWQGGGGGVGGYRSCRKNVHNNLDIWPK